MAILGTGNFIHKYGNTPQTQSIVSTRNKIFVSTGNNQYEQIGVASRFDVNFNRDVQEVAGVGYGDMIAELVPNRQRAIEITINRTAQYLMGVFQAMGYKGGVEGLVRSLRHHRWPFDIKQEIVFSEAMPDGQPVGSIARSAERSGPNDVEFRNGLKALINLYETCWMTTYGVSYSVDTTIVNEDVRISCIDVVDFQLKRAPLATEDHGGSKDRSFYYSTGLK